MISLQDVSKRYVVDHVPGKWVLRGLSMNIPARMAVGVVGAKGAGKTTLLRLITGAEAPTTGEVHRRVRVSYPDKYLKNLQPLLTGRQNAKFICRINGYTQDLPERLAQIERLARLGAKFDKPISAYSAPMKAQLSFAISWVFDFDVYVADAYNFAGNSAFGDRALAESELQGRLADSGLIMTAQGPQAESTLRDRCKAGIWLHEGSAQWFDSIEDALAACKAGGPERPLKEQSKKNGKAATAIPDTMRPVLARVRRTQDLLKLLSKGLLGGLPVVDKKSIARVLLLAKDVGIDLATSDEMAKLGLRKQEGALPVLKIAGTNAAETEYYDMKTQSVRADDPGQSGLRL